MKLQINFIRLLLFFNAAINAQDFKLYEKEFFIYESDTLSYRILKPKNYNPSKQYPVHLFLHGAGERGNDNSSQLTHGAALFLKKEARNN